MDQAAAIAGKAGTPDDAAAFAANELSTDDAAARPAAGNGLSGLNCQGAG